MESVKYSVYETPNPKKDGKKSYHARPVRNNKIIKTDKLVSEIERMSSFSTPDVKGMLEAFSSVLKSHLAEGAAIELNGIGVFSVSITCPKNIEDPSKINASNIRFKKVNFKSNVSLNKELRMMRFSRAEEEVKKGTFSEEERQRRILDMFNAEGSIQSSSCMRTNNCNRYTALKDLDSLIAADKIVRHGRKGSSFYLLKK